jgi:murein DD-endopeptidase MepM/ murein hydrolase activator NlpD
MAVLIAMVLTTTTNWLDNSSSSNARYDTLSGMPPFGVAAKVPPGPLRLVVPGLSTQGQTLSPAFSTTAIYQGGAASVRVPGAVSGMLSVFGVTYQMVPDPAGNAVQAFFGVGVLIAPGSADVLIQATDIQGATTTVNQPVTVLKTDWTVDYITLPPGVGSDLTPENVQAEEDLLAATYAGVTPRQYGDSWLPPLDDMRVTGYFGEQRSFYGGPPTGHHGGTDLGADGGTPIHAINNGTVVIARELPERGNMVIIDHGGGIFSGYGHMSKILVVEGQTVAAGQEIGEVGTTGLSTGNHLHWELAVNGILVDGLRWLDGSQGF